MADNSSIFERLEGTSLPAWSDIPDLDLYMDQVISLMKRYLGPLSASDDKGITSSMVNNYVKQGVMPAPKKKEIHKDPSRVPHHDLYPQERPDYDTDTLSHRI